MAHPRAPAPKASAYVTAEGYRALGEELRGLWERRREVVVHLSAAAAEGDRSENAEYVYRKKQLREIDHRIGYLQRRLPMLKVVDRAPVATGRAFFGAWVTLGDDAGERTRVRIVGSDELDPARGWISVDSPMAKALLGRGVGDEVRVRTPRGSVVRTVLAVSYADDAHSRHDPDD